MIVAVLLSFGVCVLGLQKGVEKITKVMMALLLILIVVLAVHSLVLPNASEGVKFYMVPNLDAIKSRGLGPVIFDAMTHAFFTLSVGIGAMEIFGRKNMGNSILCIHVICSIINCNCSV